MSAGCWLAAAIVTGATRPPLPAILVVGGLVLALPWWADGRRRPRVRVERKLEAWPVIAQAVGPRRLTGRGSRSRALGWHARFGLARGQTVDDVRAKLPAIESGLGTFRCAARVYPTPDNLAHRFRFFTGYSASPRLTPRSSAPRSGRRRSSRNSAVTVTLAAVEGGEPGQPACHGQAADRSAKPEQRV